VIILSIILAETPIFEPLRRFYSSSIRKVLKQISDVSKRMKYY